MEWYNKDTIFQPGQLNNFNMLAESIVLTGNNNSFHCENPEIFYLLTPQPDDYASKSTY